MNIEFDSYKQKLNDCKPALDALADSLNLVGLRNELERLHAMQEAPGFWDDPDKSQKIVVKTKQAETKVERYEKMLSNWDDLMTICEMAAEEDDDSMLDELKAGFENLASEMESCRLQTLLTGKFFHCCLHRIEYLRHNGSDNGSFDRFHFHTVNIQQNFQIHAVLVRSLGCLGAKSGFKNDLISLHTANDDVGVTNINSKDHSISSKSLWVRILQAEISPFSVSIIHCLSATVTSSITSSLILSLETLESNSAFFSYTFSYVYPLSRPFYYEVFLIKTITDWNISSLAGYEI